MFYDEILTVNVDDNAVNSFFTETVIVDPTNMWVLDQNVAYSLHFHSHDCCGGTSSIPTLNRPNSVERPLKTIEMHGFEK